MRELARRQEGGNHILVLVKRIHRNQSFETRAKRLRVWQSTNQSVEFSAEFLHGAFQKSDGCATSELWGAFSVWFIASSQGQTYSFSKG